MITYLLKQKKYSFNNFIWIFILLFSSFIFIELLLRYIFGLGTPPLSVPHPTIEYLFKPNQNIKRFGKKIIINQYGMRSDNFLQDKESVNEYRIMIFGDSIINGGNLTDHDNLATTLIQNKLQELTKKSVLVGNISAGSWGPGNWLAYAKEFGFFDADEIILVISSHDYADNPSFQRLNPNTHPQEQPILAIQEAFTRYFPKLLSKISTKINPPEKNDELLTPKLDQKANSIAIEQGLQDLAEFLIIATETQAKVTIIQYWEKSEVQTGKVKEGNQKIQKIAQKMNISVKQTGKTFEEAYNNQEEPFRDKIHPNDRGQELLAEIILSSLQIHLGQKQPSVSELNLK